MPTDAIDGAGRRGGLRGTPKILSAREHRGDRRSHIAERQDAPLAGQPTCGVGQRELPRPAEAKLIVRSDGHLGQELGAVSLNEGAESRLIPAAFACQAPQERLERPSVM